MLLKYAGSSIEILVREGVLDGISSAFSLHILVRNIDRKGIFMSRNGVIMANSGRIIFRIKSTGGHAGIPDTGINALRVAQALINSIDAFLSNFGVPSESIALEPVILNAGKSSNVMPADAELW
jgi:metal-dependent amidase/aminoacylase/carboxypeptidase family protein